MKGAQHKATQERVAHSLLFSSLELHAVFGRVKSMYGRIFVVLYLVIAAASGLFALFCSFTYCETLGVLIPTTPWIQLFGNVMDIEISIFLTALFYLLNATLFYVVGHAIDVFRENVTR